MNANRLGAEAISLQASIISGSSIVTSMGTLTVGLVRQMENVEAVAPYVTAIEKPSARDRRLELSQKLRKVEPRLCTKLEGAWQTLQDRSKEDRFLQAASSARELISDVLQILAPDEKVKATTWFKPVRNTKRPTRKQRARFTMLGNNDALGEEELKSIFDLAKEIGKSYDRLSETAHLRDYDTDLQTQTESLMDSCQIYLLKLLEMREKCFKS